MSQSGNNPTGPDRPRRRLAALWFADVVGFSALAARDETSAIRLIQSFQEIAAACVGSHGGRVVKYIGDAVLAEFSTTEAAVQSALELSSSFTDQPTRIGVHSGEIVSTPDGDVYGDGVNIAARLQRHAEPGQVVVSEDVWRQLRSRPDDFAFLPLGGRKFKGSEHSLGVYLARPPTTEASSGSASLSEAPSRPWAGVHRRLQGTLLSLRRGPDRARRAADTGWRRLGPVYLAVSIFLVGGAALFMVRPAAGFDFSRRDWLLVADCRNATGDSVLDGSLNTALDIGLRQSTFVNIFPRSRVNEALRRMRRDVGEPVDEETAIEIAQRVGLRAVLTCNVDRIGTTYVLSARIIDPVRQLSVRTLSTRAAEQDELIDALDRLVRDIREALGESWEEISAVDAQLSFVTTASMQALRGYSEGARAWSNGESEKAATLWKQAIAQDSGFAMAHADLALHYFWNNDRESGEAHLRKALAQKDRLAEREQLWIEARASSLRGDLRNSVHLWEMLLARYPDDRDGWYNLANTHMKLEECGKAIELYGRVLQLDSLMASALINMATCHTKTGQVGMALQRYQEALRIRPDFLTWENLNHEIGTTYVKAGRFVEADSIFRRMLVGMPGQQARGHRSLAMLEMYRGRYSSAIDHLRLAISANRAEDAHVSEFRNRLLLASAYWTKGMTDGARNELHSAREISAQTYLEPALLLFAGRLHARVGELEHANDLLELMRTRVQERNVQDSAAVLTLQGEIYLQQARYSQAIQQFEVATRKAVDKAIHRESLAMGYRLGGEIDRAMELYREIDAARSIGWEPQEEWVTAPYWLARLSAERGDTTLAIRYYREFIDRWMGGDPDLSYLNAARGDLAQLEGASRSSASRDAD